ncbi:MAG: T9SS type A sorting domain-containing protein [Bacteroidales bacterium]|nr:T9SS type A sorting domain-containing protein [Bacteroidales bacterium]
MKKLSLLICFCALVMTTFAQLPNQSYGSNFTGYEINADGTLNTTTPIVLYNWTDAGYPVFIDVFATWCPPCWSYHNSGALENLYSQYGPDGSNVLRVMAIEGDDGNFASLSGTGPDNGNSASQGNWLNGVEYPVIPLDIAPNNHNFNTNYAISYFPTIYVVCPNRLVYEVGQKTTAQLYAATTGTCPQYDAIQANNGLIFAINGFEPPYYCQATINPTIELENVGIANLTSATLTINLDGQTSTFDWTGNLARYDKTTVTLPTINVTSDGNHTYTVTVSQVNGVADPDPVMNSISKDFKVTLNPTSTTVNETFSAGIPSSWTVKNGYLFAYNISSGNHGGAVVFNAYSFSNNEVDELYLPYEDISGMTTPVLKFDVAYRRYSSSSAERMRVLYSTDCGATWTSLYNKSGAALASVSSVLTTSFTPTDNQWRTDAIDLSSITNKQNVIIKFEFKSTYGNNVWLDNVQLMDGTGIAENESEFNIYPNPAQNVLNIATDEMIKSVEIYNLQGQLVQVENGNVNSINVSNLATGNYFVRIQTNDNTITRKFTKE